MRGGRRGCLGVLGKKEGTPKAQRAAEKTHPHKKPRMGALKFHVTDLT